MIKKSLYNKYIFSFLVFCLSLNSLEAQNQRLAKSTYRALNNYVVYSNEAVHALNLMYFDFLYLNEQFYQYVEDSIDKVVYTKDNILTNPEFFPIYPRDLYPNILNDNIYIPYDKRGAPLQLIGKVVNVLKEIEDTRSLLAQYINTGDYQQDTNLVQGFKWLRRIEVLYYDMFTLQEKLHWSLTSIILNYQQPFIDSSAALAVQEFQPLLKQIKLVIKSVRAKDSSSSLSYNCLKLAEFIRQIEGRREKILAGMEKIPNSLRSPERRFDAIIKRSKNILKASQEYKSSPRYLNLDFKPNYYYYNINLLDNYNRTGDGVATLFNKFIDHNGVYWLYEHEMPHMFEVLYPNVPEYEQFKDPDFDIEELIQKALLAKAKTDSLNQLHLDSLAQIQEDSILYAQHIADSIEFRKNNPEIGDMNLTGFATNNLVFLLDISSSMRDTNKLPLLKEALVQLLDLMREEDNITFITYSGKAQVVLSPTSALNKDKIIAAIEGLSSSGSSDANKGLRLAYKTIDDSIIKDGNNRIIMATDGAIKVSQRVKRLIKRRTRDKDKIRLSVFYFSQKEFTHHKALLEELAEEGKGKYSYIQKENAKKILVTEAQSVRKKGNESKREKKDVQ